MPMPDRPLTDEEKAKLRDYQVAEILRRRNGGGPPFVEPGEAPPSLGSCPDCGKPYVNKRRCYDCKPINRAAAVMDRAHRNGDGPAHVAEADAPAGPARPRACPKCGKPYGKRVRCYGCTANTAGASGDRTPRAAPPGPGPEEVPASPEEPSLPPYVSPPPLAVIDVAGDFTPPPPDIPRGVPSFIIGAVPPVADALDALREVCKLLAPLPDGDARWVLEAANLYRCRR